MSKDFLKHALGTVAIVFVSLAIVNKVGALSSVRSIIGLTG